MQIPSALANPDVVALFDIVEAAGHEARLVGGAVRDAVLGREPDDIDLSTTMTPFDFAECANRAGLPTYVVAAPYGLVTVRTPRADYQVSTLRQRIDVGHPRAPVEFGTSWETDAQLRDLTINGLSMDRSGAVHDHVGGLDDLDAGNVRFPGRAFERIVEDPVRMIRYFRFFAQHGRGEANAEAMAACRTFADGLRSVSQYRIGSELLKILKMPDPMPALEPMAQTPVLAMTVLLKPDLQALRRHLAIEAYAGIVAHPVSRLRSLFSTDQDFSSQLRDELGLNASMAKKVSAGRQHDLTPSVERVLSMREALGAGFDDAFLQAWVCSGEGDNAEWAAILRGETMPDESSINAPGR